MTAPIFLDGPSINKSLNHDLKKCEYFYCIASYIKNSGLGLFQVQPEAIKNSTIISCSDFSITDSTALIHLKGMGYKVRLTKSHGLHAKLWIVKTPEEYHVYIGSSNLSLGGYQDNYEANALIVNEDFLTEAQKFFEHLNNDQNSFIPTDEWLREYKINEEKVQFKPDQENCGSLIRAPKPPLEEEKYDFNWNRRTASKTFLAQGIFSDLGNASDDKSLFHRIIKNKNNATIVFLHFVQNQKLQLFSKVENATVNISGGGIQIGAGRQETLEWIESVWKFPAIESRRNYSLDWDSWYDKQKIKKQDIVYDLYVDLYSTPNMVVYAKPL